MFRIFVERKRLQRRRMLAVLDHIGKYNQATVVRLPIVVWLGSAAAMALALTPRSATAHVKWFMPYNVAQSPASAEHVLTPHFLMLLAIFTLLVFAGFVSDRYIADRWPVMIKRIRRPDIEEQLLRAGMGGFFMALFATGGVLLTPELRTDADWPAWLQLCIAVSMLSRHTCALGGVGITVLYAYSASIYGPFHLADYPMFLGIAAYLLLTSFDSERLRSLRPSILYVALCASLMWGAIEKWAYPEWTLSLLALRPYLTGGLSPGNFLRFAGFVEFALSFYILAGLSLVRPAIVLLLSIFAVAVVDFGKIDAIGHLPIMVPLLVMFMHGPSRLHHWFHRSGNGILGEGHKVSVAFATSMFLFFAAYYGLQYEEYGGKANPRALVSFQPSTTR